MTLFFIMGISLPGKTVFISKQGPVYFITVVILYTRVLILMLCIAVIYGWFSVDVWIYVNNVIPHISVVIVYQCAHHFLIINVELQMYKNTVMQQAVLQFIMCVYDASEWVIKFNRLLGTADIGVYVAHTSRVIVTHTLESLSSLT